MPADVRAKDASYGNERGMTPGKPGSRPRTSWIQYRYVLILLGFFGMASVYGMRVNINVAMVVMVNQTALEPEGRSFSCPIKEDASSTISVPKKEDGPFNWDRYSQGLILGAFYYGYIITPIPGGRMAERYGAKWLFGIGALITGLLSLLLPYAAFQWGDTGVIILRILQGLGEGVTYPSMEALIAHWLPVGQRTTGIALIHTGSFFGVVVGMALSGFLADSEVMGGWPSIFYFFGIWTVLWFILWSIFISSRPEDNPWASQEEIDLISDDLGKQKPTHAKSTPWRKILTSPAVIAVAVAQFGANWLQYTLVTELPTYLGTVLHFNIKDNGIYSSLPYIGAIISGTIAGPAADFLRRREYMSTTNVRKLFNGIALFGPSMVLIIVARFAWCNGAFSLALFVIAGTLRGFSEAGYMSAPVDMAPDYAGTILGITVCFSQTTGFLVPWTTSLFIQNENSVTTWSYSFIVTIIIGVVSGLVFQFFSSSEIQEWGMAPRPAQPESQIQAGADERDSNM